MSSAAAISAFLADRESGQDVRSQNGERHYRDRHCPNSFTNIVSSVNAVTALSDIMKTSMGPNGLDKMLVDNVGEMVITNDGATILKQVRRHIFRMTLWNRTIPSTYCHPSTINH